MLHGEKNGTKIDAPTLVVGRLVDGPGQLQIRNRIAAAVHGSDFGETLQAAGIR